MIALLKWRLAQSIKDGRVGTNTLRNSESYQWHKWVHYFWLLMLLYKYTVIELTFGGVVADLFFESIDLQRINLIARMVTRNLCEGDDRALALAWIAELTDDLLRQLDEREQEEKSLQSGGLMLGRGSGLQ